MYFCKNTSQMDSPSIISSIEDILSVWNLRSFQKHPNFHIIRLEDHYDQMKKNIHLRLDGVFEIAFSRSKNFHLFADNNRIELDRDYLLFLSSGQSLKVNADNVKDVEKAYIIYFTPDFLGFGSSSYHIVKRFHFFNINYKSFFYPEKELSSSYDQYMEKIYKEFKKFDDDSIDIIRALLTIVLFKTKRNLNNLTFSDSRSLSRKDIITYQFENVIKQTQKKKQKLAFYASKLNISSVYLSEAVKHTTGKTASTILRDYILLEAHSLLKTTDFTIETIAYELGFDDTSNFINYYKKYTSLTPSQQRKNLEL